MFEKIRVTLNDIIIDLTGWDNPYAPTDFIIAAADIARETGNFDRNAVLDVLADIGCQDVVDVLETCRPYGWVQDVWFWFCDL